MPSSKAWTGGKNAEIEIGEEISEDTEYFDESDDDGEEEEEEERKERVNGSP